MNLQQIVNTLRNKGFDTKITDKAVEVSLNRNLSTMEVEIALNFAKVKLSKAGKKVLVS